ncbi:MAG: transcription-repair coupling factor [Flavobacteriales bacterium]
MSEQSNILKIYEQALLTRECCTLFQRRPEAKVQFKSAIGALQVFLVAALFKQMGRPILLMAPDDKTAVYLFDDLEACLSGAEVLYYPASYRRPYEMEDMDNVNVFQRFEVSHRLSRLEGPYVLVTSPEALFEKTVTRRELARNTFELQVGEKISVAFVNEWLFDQGFHRTDFVSRAGEFAVRGCIVDVFSFAYKQPYRIEFLGDEIESIRLFDVDTQISSQRLDRLILLYHPKQELYKELLQNFLDQLSKETLIFSKDLASAAEVVGQRFQEAERIFYESVSPLKRMTPETCFVRREDFLRALGAFAVVECTAVPYFEPEKIFELKSRPQSAFNKQFQLLLDDLDQHAQEGFANYLCCANGEQLQRFRDIFHDLGREVIFKPVIASLHEGFIDDTHRLVCYTDHQIFDRFHSSRIRRRQSSGQGFTLKSLNALQMGDYVTHMDHGIGRFAGLMKIDVHGKSQEAIKLVYRDNDILYVSIHGLHKISKFTGKDSTELKLNKLGSPAWKNLKSKTKSRVKELAFDMIQLYAKRRVQEGFSFSPDTYLQHELEASFLYEDTPDQLKATKEVKSDMESPRPMDRLICGDVGFGKTEVAIRAAFKAATDGKQVAVLVPTTLLAFQHYRTFKARLEDFPVHVDYLNRFRSDATRKKVLQDLQSGGVDIIIGTHILISKQMRFKDLGLLIVDEEHKFGVSAKDKLKILRENVDTLALTATPIPRTLQFSLMAARDISVIKTPPPNRRPIETHLIRFDPETIRDAIIYEHSHKGQVFFIHNKIHDLYEFASKLQTWVPQARIGIGHGQMDGKILETLMLDFIEGRLDILLSTAIVESGLDIPNANTIFIHQAQDFGLADLHQLRGRVGRSNIQAFCYLITPPLGVLNDEARKRLQAIEQCSDLGSGFQIAMKDLEIRGAGNLLGGEQSGFISEMGFDTYQKILNEAVEELKAEEFKDLYAVSSTERQSFVADVQIDTDMELLLPDDYVNSTVQRLQLYRELAEVEDDQALENFKCRLEDRFGPLPQQAVGLLHSVQLKRLCKALGFEKLILKEGLMLCHFISDIQSTYYQSGVFRGIIAYAQEHPEQVSFKEKKRKNGDTILLFRVDKVYMIAQAAKWLTIWLEAVSTRQSS